MGQYTQRIEAAEAKGWAEVSATVDVNRVLIEQRVPLDNIPYLADMLHTFYKAGFADGTIHGSSEAIALADAHIGKMDEQVKLMGRIINK